MRLIFLLSSLWRLQGNQTRLVHAKRALYQWAFHLSVPIPSSKARLPPAHQIYTILTQISRSANSQFYLHFLKRQKKSKRHSSLFICWSFFSGIELRTVCKQRKNTTTELNPRPVSPLLNKLPLASAMHTHFFVFPLTSPEDLARSNFLPVTENGKMYSPLNTPLKSLTSGMFGSVFSVEIHTPSTNLHTVREFFPKSHSALHGHQPEGVGQNPGIAGCCNGYICWESWLQAKLES